MDLLVLSGKEASLSKISNHFGQKILMRTEGNSKSILNILEVLEDQKRMGD
jgi:hypothetical protein